MEGRKTALNNDEGVQSFDRGEIWKIFTMPRTCRGSFNNCEMI